MKRPSFQFYPGDWLRDSALRSCSTGARGLWIDMLSYMHEGTPYGYLKVGDKVILTDNLARMVGSTLPEVEGWLSELFSAGVPSKDEHGCIFSRRMVRDEKLRIVRASGGKLGGNPALKDKYKDNHKVDVEDNQNSTPSSSSSSSSSSDSERERDFPEIPPMPRKEFDTLVAIRAMTPEFGEWFWNIHDARNWTDSSGNQIQKVEPALRNAWRSWRGKERPASPAHHDAENGTPKPLKFLKHWDVNNGPTEAQFKDRLTGIVNASSYQGHRKAWEEWVVAQTLGGGK